MAQVSSKYAPVQGDLKGWQKLARDCAQGAIYDSNERQPHSKCLPGTRVGLLQSLKALVEDPSRKIMWMAGESGSGKTTAAHTLADNLRGEGKLAGTFFFSRKHTKRSTFDHVLLTLAYQLGLQHPRAHEIIMKAIFDDPALLSQEKSRYDQLEKLIIEPLKHLAQIRRGEPGLSLILDALDEGTTRGLHHVEPFISLLARLVRDTTLPIHSIIVSSRSWPQIDAVMRSSSLADVMTVVRLEEYDSREDVDRFLRDAFDRVYDARDVSHFRPKPWPSPDDFKMLAQRARSRFIFAATIVRMVDQDQPHERLSLICSMLRGDVEHVWGNIDHLYASIIDSIEASTRDTALRYISLLVNLAEPLSLSDLRLLFGVDIYPLLLPFSALVYVPPLDSRDTVQIFHSTLRDFLQNREQTDESQVSANRFHYPLAIRCFRTMARTLKRDICELQDPSLLHDEIPDFPQKRGAISHAVRYACLYWLHHLEGILPDNDIQGCLLEFLERRLLYFIEVCAVLGELDAAVGLLRAARKHVMGWPTSSFPLTENAMGLLYDGWRLIMDSFDSISVSALHVYESALPCAPAKSRIRLTYSHVLSETTCITIEDGLDDHWDCVTRVIEMKTDDFEVALSPDTSQVATFRMDSEDTGTIMLWDTATGVLVTSYLLEGICEPSFDYDDRTDLIHGGSFVAIRDSQQCYVWRPSNQTVSRIAAPRTEHFFGPLSVSRNGDKIAALSTSVTATGKYFTIRVYDTVSLQQISHWSFPFHFKELPLVALDFSCKDDCLLVRAWPFSPFLKQSFSYILLIDATDGQLLWHDEYDCSNAIFSSDDDIIIIKSESASVSLLRRVSPPAIAPTAQPTFRPKPVPLSLLSGKRWRQGPLRSDRKLPSVTCTQARMYQAVDPKTSSHLLPEFVTEPISYEQVAMRQGDKINAFVRSGCTMKKTMWRSQNVECFGISSEAGTGTGAAQIIDLSQAVATPIDSSNADIWRSEAEGHGYEWSVSSRQRDVTAYKSKTAWTRRNKYTLVGFGTSTEDAFSCKIVPETLKVALSSDVTARDCIGFSPKSTYFSALTIRRGKGRIQVWNSRSGALIGSASVEAFGLEVETTWEMNFGEDEILVVLSCWSYGSHSVFIHVYSLENNTVKYVDSITPPSPICAEPCVIASVTRDAVDYFCADRDHSLVHHLRWKRETSTSISVSSFPYLGYTSNSNIMHSPSFTRIYYRIPDESTESALNLRTSASDGTGTYEIDEDDGPKAFYDHRSWSDLCLDVDGWLRQRSRRICWLPERYRPADLGSRGLELMVEGNTVTVMKLRDEKRITIRLHNIDISFFE